MDYYNEIKNTLIDVEVYKKVKDYSKNRYELEKYYNVGKLLYEAGNAYGEDIIGTFAQKLVNEINKKYNKRYLFDIRKLYLFSKMHPLDAQLSISHYRILFPIKDNNAIDYYMRQAIKRNLGKRELTNIIKSKEYERLDDNTKLKLITKEEITISDNIKHPIIIKNRFDNDDISEKMLKQLILEDIFNFMKELGTGFSLIDSEYKIKIGDTSNYIDLLLLNYEFNAFVVVELKVTKLKKEHVGQIQIYMNYIDKCVKKAYHEKTIGIIITRHGNDFIMEFCSDPRINNTTYKLIHN